MIFTVDNFLKILKNPGYLITYAKIRSLYKCPRYTEIHSDLLGRDIRAVDSMSLVFMYKEIFEKEIYKFQAESENPLIIDCGANIGLSVIYFNRLYPKSRVIAFEPDKKVFQSLQYNIASFDVDDVELISAAVWNNETVVEFFHEGADGGRIAVGDEPNKNLVKTVRLRNYLQEKVDFLKIDIEGAEHVVLADCRDLLKNVKNLFVEYHSFDNEEQNLDEILSILRLAGFRVYVEHIGIRSKYPFISRNTHAGMDLQLNIFAYRK